MFGKLLIRFAFFCRFLLHFFLHFCTALFLFFAHFCTILFTFLHIFAQFFFHFFLHFCRVLLLTVLVSVTVAEGTHARWMASVISVAGLKHAALATCSDAFQGRVPFSESEPFVGRIQKRFIGVPLCALCKSINTAQVVWRPYKH